MKPDNLSNGKTSCQYLLLLYYLLVARKDNFSYKQVFVHISIALGLIKSKIQMRTLFFLCSLLEIGIGNRRLPKMKPSPESCKERVIDTEWGIFIMFGCHTFGMLTSIQVINILIHRGIQYFPYEIVPPHSIVLNFYSACMSGSGTRLTTWCPRQKMAPSLWPPMWSSPPTRPWATVQRCAKHCFLYT